MNNYIHKIIDFFFHHDVSDEMATRVYRRMVSPTEDKMREEAVARIWNKLNNASCPEEKIEKAFHQLESSIKDEKRTESVAAPKRKQILRRISPVGVAAFWTIPLIMACLSAYYYYSTQSYVAQKLSEVTYVQHYAAIGTRNEVLLPDGSKVCLNAGTLLIYPSTFASEARNVYLSGEAFFEVAKDKEHPFTVTTNHLTLKVLGTTFNVSAYPDNNQVMATLETGKLQVKVNEQPAEYLLEPNDQLIYTPATGKIQRHKVNTASYSDWRTGGLFFGNTPFSDVLHTLERAYGVNFHLHTSAYQNQSLRVHFNKGESLEHVLQIIKILIPGIEYEIAGKNIYVK